jgi:hypothetical protein
VASRLTAERLAQILDACTPVAGAVAVTPSAEDAAAMAAELIEARGQGWSDVLSEGGRDAPRCRRLCVPGGWLYQIEHISVSESNLHDQPRITTFGWHPPVFVPGGAS